MPYQPAPLKKATVASVCYRLYQLYGEATSTWENRMHGAASDYRQVARINRELRAAGLTEKVAELMEPIDASVAALPCAEAEYREKVSDAREDLLQADADKTPCEATVRALARYRAVMRQASLDDDLRRCAAVGIAL